MSNNPNGAAFQPGNSLIYRLLSLPFTHLTYDAQVFFLGSIILFLHAYKLPVAYGRFSIIVGIICLAGSRKGLKGK